MRATIFIIWCIFCLWTRNFYFKICILAIRTNECTFGIWLLCPIEINMILLSPCGPWTIKNLEPTSGKENNLSFSELMYEINRYNPKIKDFLFLMKDPTAPKPNKKTLNIWQYWLTSSDAVCIFGWVTWRYFAER